MKKLVIPIILTVTVLIAGVFAFTPVEQASTVHTTIGPTILSLQKTLDGVGPGAGDDVTWTLTAVTDVVVMQIFRDNTPTGDAGLCVFTGPHDSHGPPNDERVDCDNSSYRVIDIEFAGSQFKGNEYPDSVANNDHISISDFRHETLNGVPLKAGETMKLSFDTINGVNDVIIEISFSVLGVATLA